MTDRPRTATALFGGARNGVTTGLPVTIDTDEGLEGGAAGAFWIEVGTVETIWVTVTVVRDCSVTVTVTSLAPPWFAFAEFDAAAGAEGAAGDTAAGDATAGDGAAGWAGAFTPAGTGAGLGLSGAT
jgi:hypothetical protein